MAGAGEEVVFNVLYSGYMYYFAFNIGDILPDNLQTPSLAVKLILPFALMLTITYSTALDNSQYGLVQTFHFGG